ncbi:MAG: helix-turn-helix transcriptional regulator [Chitinophagales bacterium]|nr:helix-turn-helix transcriptional regulator [Chitinophagales bacterium]
MIVGTEIFNEIYIRKRQSVSEWKITEMENGVMLTKREKEVLDLIMQGLTSTEIAALIFISLDTVETHRKNIIQKMNARNVVDAVVRALGMGFIN